MLLQIENILTQDEIRHANQVMDNAEWINGGVTAGHQSTLVKHNMQIREGSEDAQQLGNLVLSGLHRSNLFFSAALPHRIYPPLFNRYQAGMDFGNHIDNAIRGRSNPIRTDISATLFFSNPDEYDGGELLIEDTYGCQSVKLAAGNMILYPATSLHRVTPVTRGARRASFFWIQSMVRDSVKRGLLFDMDMAIQNLNRREKDSSEIIMLTGCYHNLLRMWAEI